MRDNQIKITIEVDVFCGDVNQPPAHLVMRYLREQFPAMCMKEDLDKMDTHRIIQTGIESLKMGDLDGALEAFKEKRDWDDYSVHFNSKFTLSNS